LFGHRLIRIAYSSQSTIVNRWLMPGRAVTSVERYLARADRIVIDSTISFIACLAFLLVLYHRPVWVVFSSAAMVLSLLLMITLTQRIPSLIPVLHLENIPYFEYNTRFAFDAELGYKQKPLVQAHFGSSKWITDQDGFRNRPSSNTNADIVVFGDGLITNGNDESDTFCERLERHVSNLTVRNFGSDGYGPFEYLALYERYGIKAHPKYAVIGFNEGNDVEQVGYFAKWRAGTASAQGIAAAEGEPLWQQYLSASMQTVEYTGKSVWDFADDCLRLLDGISDYDPPIDREFAVVKINDAPPVQMHFIDWLDTRSAEEISQTPEFAQLTQILTEFRDLSIANGVVPVLMFIPTPGHIYGEYSTDASGEKWLAVRDQQIAAKPNLENAMIALCQKLGIQMIDLTQRFEAAAKQGMIVYHLLDTHWNSEGMEIAAVYAAEVMQSDKSYLQVEARTLAGNSGDFK